ncbi:YadA-like family protein (plasmid) [Yersinia massiliensis]|uniref:YadA C-terminal domain-containing protein n=1 Tax=Yersinia massiliensis TaxID=419257 RepID=UPI001561CF32|nr:YadA C-terminal domain-containing protein [Yersinia massiliensis]QKJ09271.1 YadA-like family protein [Yersinia massiliensis]
MSTNKIVLKKLTTAILLALFASTGSAYAAGLTASGCDIASESNGSQQKIICSEANFDIDIDTSKITEDANNYTNGQINNVNNIINQTSNDDREYTDQKASEAESGANSYTNNEINTVNNTINQTSIDDREYTDQKASEAESGANSYTNNEINTVNNTINQTSIDDREYTDQKSATAESNANIYTDSKITDTKNELNVSIDNAKNESITTSNTYTDNKYDQSINYATNVANQAESNANTYTDNKFNQLSESSNQRFNQLGDKINQAEKRLNAGIAGVTAIASIPYVAENGFSYGVGLGNYSNGNAIAGGVQYKTSPNTNIRLNVSWDSSSNAALGVGFAGGW